MSCGQCSPRGACGWKQTGECSSSGPREPFKDKTCDAPVADGNSGYCLCEGGVTLGFGCRHHTLTCNAECTFAGYSALSDSLSSSQSVSAQSSFGSIIVQLIIVMVGILGIGPMTILIIRERAGKEMARSRSGTGVRPVYGCTLVKIMCVCRLVFLLALRLPPPPPPSSLLSCATRLAVYAIRDSHAGRS